MSVEPEQHEVLPLPPFMWIWLGFVLVWYLPGLLPIIGEHFSGVGEMAQLYCQMGLDSTAATVSAYTSALEGVLPLGLPVLILLASCVTLLIPGRRGRNAEQHLHELPQLPKVEEIRDYIHSMVPGMTMRGNLVRGDQQAFVYPSSFASNRLALFGPVVKAWRSDPEGAQALLLHELAHDRSYDPLFIGSGSALRFLLNRSLVLLFMLPLILGGLDYLLYILQELISGTMSLIGFYDFILLVFGHIAETVPTLVAMSGIWIQMWFLIATPSLLAIWGMEISADTAAANAQGSSAPLIRMLSARRGRISIGRWLLERVSHPPIALRVTLLRANSSPFGRTVAAVLFFPVTFLLLSGTAPWTIVTYIANPAELWLRISTISTTWFDAFIHPSYLLLIMTLYVIAWPFFMLFTERVDRSMWTPEKRVWISAHVVAGGLIFLLQFVCLNLLDL